MDECDTRRLCTRAQVTKSYGNKSSLRGGGPRRARRSAPASSRARQVHIRSFTPIWSISCYRPYRITARTLRAYALRLSSILGCLARARGRAAAAPRGTAVRRDRSGHIRYSLISVRLAYNVNSRASLARPAGTRTGPPHAPIAEGKGRPNTIGLAFRRARTGARGPPASWLAVACNGTSPG